MDIIINSLYTKKEVFIRELISNASDALDKARFLAVKDVSFLQTNPDLEIKIDFDVEQKTISITDTGVGMTKAELVKNLGTVAKSGTTAFLEQMGTGDSGMSMIGQFGVGFYSAFLVANKVTVTSKNNDDEQHVWTSTADSKFFVTKDPRGDTLGRGTRVTLHLKDDALEYIEEDRIKNLVKKYSEFINYPISLYTSRSIEEEVPLETEPIQEEELTTQEEQESNDEQPKTQKVTRQVWEWQLINEIKAIWLRPKQEIEDREYKDFYKTITKDSEDPLAYSHFSAEGEIEFKAILYIPRTAPYNLFEDYYGVSSEIKLYVRRVLITEEFTDLMPKYLNFVKGVVDSDDLPLNVSREQLQQMKMIKVMSKKLVRKTIDMLTDLADESYEEVDEDDEGEATKDIETTTSEETASEETSSDENSEDKYELFWSNFGKNIKLGVIEDSSNRMKLAKLLRFYSTHDQNELTSLDEYISRMKEDQDTILYLPGDSKQSILKNPILKKYTNAGYEVLILNDPIDEFTTQHLSEYEKRKVKSIAKDDVNIFDSGAEEK
jgi:heat shock protein beta